MSLLLNVYYEKWSKLSVVLTVQCIGSPIKFKHIVILSNKAQTLLSFSRIIKFNVTRYLNLIGVPIY